MSESHSVSPNDVDLHGAPPAARVAAAAAGKVAPVAQNGTDAGPTRWQQAFEAGQAQARAQAGINLLARGGDQAHAELESRMVTLRGIADRMVAARSNLFTLTDALAIYDAIEQACYEVNGQ